MRKKILVYFSLNLIGSNSSFRMFKFSSFLTFPKGDFLKKYLLKKYCKKIIQLEILHIQKQKHPQKTVHLFSQESDLWQRLSKTENLFAFALVRNALFPLMRYSCRKYRFFYEKKQGWSVFF